MFGCRSPLVCQCFGYTGVSPFYLWLSSARRSPENPPSCRIFRFARGPNGSGGCRPPVRIFPFVCGHRRPSCGHPWILALAGSAFLSAVSVGSLVVTRGSSQLLDSLGSHVRRMFPRLEIHHKCFLWVIGHRSVCQYWFPRVFRFAHGSPGSVGFWPPV